MNKDTKKILIISSIIISCSLVNGFHSKVVNKASEDKIISVFVSKYKACQIDENYYLVSLRKTNVVGMSAIGIKSYSYIVNKNTQKCYVLEGGKMFPLKICSDSNHLIPVKSKDNNSFYISLNEYNLIVNSTLYFEVQNLVRKQ